MLQERSCSAVESGSISFGQTETTKKQPSFRPFAGHGSVSKEFQLALLGGISVRAPLRSALNHLEARTRERPRCSNTLGRARTPTLVPQPCGLGTGPPIQGGIRTLKNASLKPWETY